MAVDPLLSVDSVEPLAIAVHEGNAADDHVVIASTIGAAGIIAAV